MLLKEGPFALVLPKEKVFEYLSVDGVAQAIDRTDVIKNKNNKIFLFIHLILSIFFYNAYKNVE